MIPYQRRSGTNQCWPVSVTMGVTSRHRNRQISAPVPSVSSTDTAKVLLFSVSERGQHEEKRDYRRGAEQHKRDRLPLRAARRISMISKPLSTM